MSSWHSGSAKDIIKARINIKCAIIINCVRRPHLSPIIPINGHIIKPTKYGTPKSNAALSNLHPATFSESQFYQPTHSQINQSMTVDPMNNQSHSNGGYNNSSMDTNNLFGFINGKKRKKTKVRRLERERCPT